MFSSNNLRWLYIGILIRILIMPFFSHPDLFWINLGPLHLNDGIFNIYEYHGDFKNIHLFKYPPLAYFILGLNLLIFKPALFSLFNLKNITDFNFFQKWYNSSDIFQNLFFLKLHYLAMDILLITVIFKLTKKKDIFKYWSFCPLFIYAVYMYSQFDIIPVALIFLSILLFSREKYSASCFTIGLAGMLKHFPFLLLPLFIILMQGNFLNRVKAACAGVIPYILIISLYCSSPSFMSDVLTNSSGYLSDDCFIFSYISVVIIITLIILFSKKINNRTNLLIRLSFTLLSIFLIFSKELHPQFIIWIAPFILIVTVSEKKYISAYVFLIIFYFIYIHYCFGRNSSWLLLCPIDNDLTMLPSAASLTAPLISAKKIITFSKIAFNIILVYLIFFYPEQKQKERSYN